MLPCALSLDRFNAMLLALDEGRISYVQYRLLLDFFGVRGHSALSFEDLSRDHSIAPPELFRLLSGALSGLAQGPAYS